MSLWLNAVSALNSCDWLLKWYDCWRKDNYHDNNAENILVSKGAKNNKRELCSSFSIFSFYSHGNHWSKQQLVLWCGFQWEFLKGPCCLEAWTSASGNIRSRGTFKKWRPVESFWSLGGAIKGDVRTSAATSFLLCFPTGRQTACHLLWWAASQQAPTMMAVNHRLNPPTLNPSKPFLSPNVDYLRYFLQQQKVD